MLREGQKRLRSVDELYLSPHGLQSRRTRYRVPVREGKNARLYRISCGGVGPRAHGPRALRPARCWRTGVAVHLQVQLYRTARVPRRVACVILYTPHCCMDCEHVVYGMRKPESLTLTLCEATRNNYRKAYSDFASRPLGPRERARYGFTTVVTAGYII